MGGSEAGETKKKGYFCENSQIFWKGLSREAEKQATCIGHLVIIANNRVRVFGTDRKV